MSYSLVAETQKPSSSMIDVRDKCLKVLEVMYLTRFMDDKMGKLVRQNKGGTFHMPVTGHELVGAVSGLSLTPGKDWGLPYYRDRGFALGLGCDVVELLGTFMARAVEHHSGGRMMPEHFSHKELRIPCQSSVVGSQFLQATGVALGVKLSGKDEVVYVSAGDGATSQGDFHEALNFACLHNLPVIFMIQNNGWAISVPLKEQTAGTSIANVAKGFAGLEVASIDGCDYEQVSIALKSAIERGRSGLGPTLIVADVPRLCAHSSSDDPAKYKTQDIIDEELMCDPIPRYENWLKQMGLASQVDIETLKQEIRDRIEEAAVIADRLSHPDPDSAADNVFKEAPAITEMRFDYPSQEAVVMVDVLNHALDEEMTQDKGIIVFGQDVAKGKGGVFGVTRHLTLRHGDNRCFNSPLAESTIVGVAMGLSFVEEFKPVVEIQFADYCWTGINQLFNELSSIYYRSNGEWNCPVVIRMPCGGYIQGGPYHSQSIEGFLAHCPGLKVVIPSNAADAKRLLKAAIRDPNPVVFLEHKALYRQRVFSARPEPRVEEIMPLGKAQMIREGRDLTVVGWGMSICMVAEIAEQLFQEDISVEVIDLCTIVPLDLEAILASVRKTGKLLIAQEASIFGGFGGEIAALVNERAFNHLDAPIMRVGAKHCPVPYSKILEDAVLPQKRDFEKAIRELSAF
ncbi:MAG: MFS transporter [Simkania sp.]|nr:MFS transporter [Simkania sp.]